MTVRLPFTELSLRKRIAAARKAGLRVVEIKSDGTVVVDEAERHCQNDEEAFWAQQPPKGKANEG